MLQKGGNVAFSDELRETIEEFHLLSHPFYQSWNEGTLSKEVLQKYAKEYHSHVQAFPRYISATHAQCDDIAARRVLLENLNDEEGWQGKPHPELWVQFARGLGVEFLDGQRESTIQNVISTFMDASKHSFHTGLASLYAYEYQVPEVAETKIDGLIKYYGVESEEALEFFRVHLKADIYHRQAIEKLLDDFSEEEKQEALIAAKKSAKALWDFLTSMQALEDVA